MRFIFKTDYGQDINLAKHGGHVFWYSVLLLLLLAAPWLFAEYYLAQLTFILIYAVAGLGLMLAVGFTGLFSLGHAAFLGVGAYTQAVLTNAAREGARAGSIYQTTTAPAANQSFPVQVAAIDTARAAYVRQETQRMVGPLVSFPTCSTTFTYMPDPPTTGNPYRELDSLTVSLACPRRLFFGLVGTNQITLSARATMRIEPGGVAPSP